MCPSRGRDEATGGAPEAENGGRVVHARVSRAFELLVMLATNDGSAHPHTIALRQRVHGSDEERPIGRRGPLDQHEHRIGRQALQLTDDESRA